MKRRNLTLSDGRTLRAVDITQQLERRKESREWPAGPWNYEPDKIVWVDEDTNLDCMVVRNHLGAYCGYVGLPESHPWFGFDYGQCMTDCGKTWCNHSLEGALDVHGGITYTAPCQEDGDICHTPRKGRPHDVWWVGFDCAHGGDFIPGLELARSVTRLESSGNFPGEVYRDLGFVVSQVKSLAEQCAL